MKRNKNRGYQKLRVWMDHLMIKKAMLLAVLDNQPSIAPILHHSSTFPLETYHD